MNIPFVLSIFLITIKYLYYYLNVISTDQYDFIKKNLWFFYNSEKTISETYNKEEYRNYTHSENGYKRYLI